jgi:hypothetical protein
MAETLFNQEDVARLDRSQSVRMMIIDQMTEGGKLPEDKSDRAFLLEALNGMDRTTLSRAKLKVESDSAQNAAATVQIVGEILMRVSGNNHTIIEGQVHREIPVLPTDIIVENPVEGETMIGVETLTYDSFLAKDM